MFERMLFTSACRVNGCSCTGIRVCWWEDVGVGGSQVLKRGNRCKEGKSDRQECSFRFAAEMQ